MRPFSFFFALFAAFFSFGVMAGTFLVSLLLFFSLLMAFSLIDSYHSTGESEVISLKASGWRRIFEPDQIMWSEYTFWIWWPTQ